MNKEKLHDKKLLHRNLLHSYTPTMKKKQNEKLEREIKKTISLTIAMKRIKYYHNIVK